MTLHSAIAPRWLLSRKNGQESETAVSADPAALFVAGTLAGSVVLIAAVGGASAYSNSVAGLPSEMCSQKHLFWCFIASWTLCSRIPTGGAKGLVARAARFAPLSTRVPPYSVVHGEPISPISQWPLRTGIGSVIRAAPADTLTGLEGAG